MSRAVVHILRLAAGRLSIFDQLCLEEALLRSDKRNWCVRQGREEATHAGGPKRRSRG